MVVNDKKFIYAKESLGISEKTHKIKKWFELCGPFITYRWINYTKSLVHSDSEMLKMVEYDLISDNIMKDIIANLKPNEPIKIGIEGYSYSSSSGPIIDLVTFSTLLRRKLLTLSNDVTVFPPTSLKLAAAKLTYPPTIKGVKVKKYEYRDNNGLAGGSFKKPDMMMALVNNPLLIDDWVEFLRYHSQLILEVNTVPKPIEDMNDAKLLYEILKTHK